LDFYPPLRLARFGFAAAGFFPTDATLRIFQNGERSGVGLVARQSRVITTPTIIMLACVAAAAGGPG
jgi:hypothetical protein